MKKIIKIAPQPGKQEEFQKSGADIVFYGGAAGGGKTFALLLEFLRHKDIHRFNSVIFRRKLTDAKKEGSIFDEASNLYGMIHPKPKRNKSNLSFAFSNESNTSSISFSGMEYEEDKRNWDGAQICFIGFDELTHFTETQFWYLVGRNRSVCGVRPYMRATCNPDPESWVKDMIEWWLDKDNQYADESKSGVIRWFIRIENKLKWFDSKREADQYVLKNGLYEISKSGKKYPVKPTSFTFIPADIYDNEELLKRNPEYLSRLQSLSLIERERLLKGNWKIKASAGLLFRREWFEIVRALPSNMQGVVRYWDRAGTDPKQQAADKKKNKEPCKTAGCLMYKSYNNVYYIAHMSTFMKRPKDVRVNIKNIASQDGPDIDIWLEQEPGSSGIADVDDIITILDGYYARPDRPSGDKIKRALPLSAQAEAGNVKLLEGDWNDDFLTEAENFDGSTTSKKDQIDASSGAYKKLQAESKLLELDDLNAESEKAIHKKKKFEKKGSKNPGVSARIQAKKESRKEDDY